MGSPLTALVAVYVRDVVDDDDSEENGEPVGTKFLDVEEEETTGLRGEEGPDREDRGLDGSDGIGDFGLGAST